MNTLATTMLRMDHTQVMTLFQQYAPDAPATLKQALVETICIALEVHAHLEEEIFYPALREVGIDTEVVEKSLPEHAAIHRGIDALRHMAPTEPGYDDTFMELMRNVIHHVADEETILLPDAERLLAGQLSDIGARMAWRRMQLSAPYTPELTSNLLQLAAVGPMVLAGALPGAGWLTGAWSDGSNRSRPG